MMRKFSLLLVTIIASSQGLKAQTPFANENLMSSDLIGTARYVAMGGAMGALGTEISAISSNPASIGLSRKNDVSFTFGVLTQKERPNVVSDFTHMTFDQIGFIFSTPMMNGGSLKFVNFAVNYQKKANFNNTFIADNNNLQGLSQTQQMAEVINFYNSPLGNLMYDAYLIDPIYITDNDGNIVTDEDGNALVDRFVGYDSDVNQYKRTTEGGIYSYDFNISANINDRFYAGVTIGLDKVDYRNTSIYSEGYYSNNNSVSLNELYTVYNNNVISGNGINAKFGLVFRPIEYSAFRIGLAIETPTAYNLEAYNVFSLDSPFNADGEFGNGRFYNYSSDNLDALYYNLSTPWKYRISLGHTVGTYLALGAEYEYADYSKIKQSYDDVYYGNTVGDDYMKILNKETLNGVHSFKFGMELNVTNALSVRCGYNYYSSSYKDNVHLDHLNESPAFNYLTTTDYMKKSDINIFTAGLGYKWKHFYTDIAYKYRKQSADFYAFDDTYAGGNILEPVFVDLTNHSVSLSLGYRF